VQQAGPDKDMGGWTAGTFSEEQQAMFGINEEGTVIDQGVHEAALATLRTNAKKEWPELVGTPAEQARTAILNERPDLARVDLMNAGDMMTMDMREDRVRVMVQDGKVCDPPRVG